MKIRIFCSFFVFLTFLSSCDILKKNGVCETTEHVKFRNLQFTFPLSGRKVSEIASGKIEYIQGWIKTDSLIGSEKIYWYFDSHDTNEPLYNTDNYMHTAAIYGVSMLLYNEEHKTEKGIIRELKLTYPGEYIQKDHYGTSYWIYDKGCLKILIQKRAYFINPNSSTGVVIPVISFCYGLTDSQMENYVNNLGSIADTE